MNRTMKIGVFDSGVGGLSILKELMKTLPSYEYVYYGDNAHIPYGNKTNDEIYQYVEKAVNFLFKKDCAIIILACNTATAAALRRLQQGYLKKTYPNRRVLGVILPACEAAVKLRIKRVGVIGTTSTIQSKSFVIELQKLQPTVEVFQNDCPLLVPVIESGSTGVENIDYLLHSYLAPLLEQNIEALILGCTHYSHVADKIQTIVGPSVQVISETNITATKFKDYLYRHPEIEQQLIQIPKETYFVTKKDTNYQHHMKFFLEKPIDTVYLVP